MFFLLFLNFFCTSIFILFYFFKVKILLVVERTWGDCTTLENPCGEPQGTIGVVQPLSVHFGYPDAQSKGTLQFCISKMQFSIK
jgi:hypothetical protein